MSSNSFSIGLRFYYWDFYKNIDELPRKEHNYGIIKDHSGYKVRELYVTKRYQSFGEEIMNYKQKEIDIKRFKDLAMAKARLYIQTEMAKSKEARSGKWFPKHYDFKGTSLKIDNLISVILYTDTTELSSDFSSTFRKKHPYETLSQIKQRNSKYWWWSKTLRETVELFGDKTAGSVNKLFKGPFYTGMSFVMNVPSFAIRLCSPTSTSVQIAVAIKFSGEQGLMLQLDTTKMIPAVANVRAFDCSWISQYKEEDERYLNHIILFILYVFFFFSFIFVFLTILIHHRLFFGGFHPIVIESVRLIHSNKNFEYIMRALYFFDSITSNTRLLPSSWSHIEDEHVDILAHLIKYQSDREEGADHQYKERYDGYIYQTFDCFIRNKREIYIRMENMANQKANEKMRNLIMHPL